MIGWAQEPNSNVKFHGYLPRKQMFSEMSHNSIGLIPFKNHWSHAYLNPNKAYEYAHAGLFGTVHIFIGDHSFNSERKLYGI